jgi:Smg protein
MKNTVIEVLAFLFDSISQRCFANTVDQKTLMFALQDVGFNKEIILETFGWLACLARLQRYGVMNKNTKKSIRILSEEEANKISSECYRFIFKLDQEEILSEKNREIVLTLLMHLGQQSIDVVDVKWVTLLVLLSQPEGNNAEPLRKFLLETTDLEII